MNIYIHVFNTHLYLIHDIVPLLVPLSVFLVMTIRCCSVSGRVSFERALPRPPSPREEGLPVVKVETEAVRVVLDRKMAAEMELLLRTSTMLTLNQRHLMTVQQRRSQVRMDKKRGNGVKEGEKVRFKWRGRGRVSEREGGREESIIVPFHRC
jgi:hypothetical protein